MFPRIDNPEDRTAFDEAELALRRVRASQGLLYGAIAMPAGAGLDMMIYPQQMTTLSVIRCVASLILLLGLLVTWYARSAIQRQTVFVAFSFLEILVPALAMCGMIYVTDGGRSTYYVGLMLMMVVVQLLGFGLVDSAVYCLLTIAAYLLAVFAHGGIDGNEGGLIFAATFFLTATAVLTTAVCHLNQLHRRQDFLLQEELRRSLGKLQAAESQLVQSEKMRAVGGLAAGLLHEINNPVNFTLMAVQTLEKELAKGREVGEIVTDIRDGIRRISDIVTDLRAFAYPEQGSQRTEFPLVDAVRTAVRFSAGACRNVHVDVHVPDDLRVIAAHSQVTQIFVNLLQNAAAALARRPASDSPPVIRISAVARDGRARINVVDNGPGIAADDLPHVCEPFYRAANSGPGLGLGLSICHSLAAGNGGMLEVRSELGRGVTAAFDLECRVAEGDNHEHAA